MRSVISSPLRSPLRAALRHPLSKGVGAAAPIVANQAMSFGRLTLSGAGAAALVNTGGAISSITLGTRTTGSDHFTTSGGSLVPSSVPSDAQYVWTGCTALGPGGDSATFTLTIDTVASRYSVKDATEFEAAIDAIGTASGGAVGVLMRAGDYQWPQAAGASTWLRSRNFANTVTIKSHDLSNRARFLLTKAGFADSLTEYRSPKNTTFESVKFYAPYTRGVAPFSGDQQDKGLTLIGAVEALVFDDCEFYSNLLSIGYGDCFAGGLLASDGSTSFTGAGLHVKGCTFHDAEIMISLFGDDTSGVTIDDDCEFYNFGSDCIKLSGINDAILRDIDMHSPYADPNDVSHGDFIQIDIGNDDATAIDGLIFERIRMNAARSDGLTTKHHYQGIFAKVNASGLTAIPITNFEIRDIVFYSQASNGIYLANAQDCLVERVTLVYDPAWYDVSEPPAKLTLVLNGTGATASNNTIRDSVYAGIDLVGSGNTVTNNVEGDHTDFATLFDGPSFAVTTISGLMAAFDPKAGAALDTANPKIGAIGTYADYTANTSSDPHGLALVQKSVYSDVTRDTNQNLVLPSGIAAGNILVAVMRTATLRTVTSIPSGWSLLTSDVSDTGFYIYTKTAAGTEGGTTITWVTSSLASTCFAFMEVAAPLGQVEVQFASALDPPSITPTGGSANTVIMAVTTARRNDNAVTNEPSGYDDPHLTVESLAGDTTSGGEVTLGMATKTAVLTSEDPGAFTWTGTTTTGAQSCTIAVR